MIKNKSADGLRGIAAFNVAVNHFLAAFLPIMLHNNYPASFSANAAPSKLFEFLTSPFVTIFYNGHFAVLVFFVLSGYVLTLPYYSERNDYRNVLERRLWGRYLRLNIPVLAAIFLAYVVYRMGLYSNIKASELSGSTTWLKNYYPPGITNSDAVKEALYQSIILGKSILVPPVWSLKIEFVGSLYLLLFYISKPKQLTAIPLMMVFLLIYALHKDDSIYYYAIFSGSLINKFKGLAHFRFIIFIIGFYLGAFQFESIAYDFLPNVNFSGGDIWERKTFYNTLGAIFITFSVSQGLGSKIFESRLFQFLGKISFSIYLIHCVVLCSLASFMYIHFPQTKLFLAANFVVYILACFAVSIAFEKVVDQRAIKISYRFTSRLFS